MDVLKTSIVEQSPAMTNSVAESKPRPPQTSNLLEGYICNSWNGGILKPIAYKKIMAGEKVTNYSIRGIIRMLTPKVPVAQKLTTTFKIFFVPNTRVWTNYEKYLSRKGGLQTTKIDNVPTLGASGSHIIAVSPINGVITTDTTLWRDSYTSSYIPRIFTQVGASQAIQRMNMLLIRGFPAIYNDMLRHKVYDQAMTEYLTDTVTTQEYNDRIPNINTAETLAVKLNKFVKRGRRKDSYYTNYRTESEGVNNSVSPMYFDLMEHNEWQKKIAESRSQAENEQKNDWDIVAEIRGSVPVSDGKVQFLGMREIGINYQQVSQTTYNNGENINIDQQVLGATGAFSYTEFNISMLNYHQFKEDGYIHVIAQTSADTVFETGIDRHQLNCLWDSEYRPDFKELKEDVLQNSECNGIDFAGTANNRGFKRKYSEYFKLPNVINGDMTSTPIFQVQPNGTQATTEIPRKPEFQFFESADEYIYDENTGLLITKAIFQDFTDVLINKNLAVRETVNYESQSLNNTTIWLEGANQLFMIANASCITNQPIDETIKNDFKKWGEQ